MTPSRPAATPLALPPLAELRAGLLRLHKRLLHRERGLYQREHGPVESGHVFLGLVLSHPQFQWLRTLSELIVNIDEALDDELTTPDIVQALFEEARALLAFVAPATEFHRHCAQARDADPDVLLEVTALYRLLRE